MDSNTVYEQLSGLNAILPDARARVDVPPPRTEAAPIRSGQMVDLRRLLWRGRFRAFDLAYYGGEPLVRPG